MNYYEEAKSWISESEEKAPRTPDQIKAARAAAPKALLDCILKYEKDFPSSIEVQIAQIKEKLNKR